MGREKFKLVLWLLLLPLTIMGQKIEVVRFSLENSENMYVHWAEDLNGAPCALIKIRINDDIDKIEGNIIGVPQKKQDETWIYVTDGSKLIKIYPHKNASFSVKFADFGIKVVKGKCSYIMDTKETNSFSVTTQKLIVDCNLPFARLLIDGKLYDINGHAEIRLPYGSYTYTIESDGYVKKNGMVKLQSGTAGYINVLLKQIGQSNTESAEVVSAGELNRMGYEAEKNNDYVKAVKFYRKAAERGFPQAQHNLGVCYDKGRGVEQNYQEAAKWFQKAANQGLAKAFNNLGIYYKQGNGVIKDKQNVL